MNRPTIVPKSTQILAADPAAIEVAAEILRQGGLVAFATETVYGLGADATNAVAVASIFEAKGRPASNPLIVHVDSLSMARPYLNQLPARAERLAEQFWPGPLTLVLRRSERIPDIVSAGRDTLALRVPASGAALALIGRLGKPIAAPSANRSSGLSPTRASHVLKDLDGRIDLILDSGPTSLGLESTVVDLTTEPPHLLRPGPISQHELATALGTSLFKPDDAQESAMRSPGRLAIHYAPRTPAVRVEPDRLSDVAWPARAALLVLGERDVPPIPGLAARQDLPTPNRAAEALYATLHHWDEQALDLIVIVPPPDRPEWCAIRDRIQRATHPG